MQSQSQSATEIISGTIAGLALAWIAGQYWIYPMFHVQVDYVLNLKMTSLFTIVSIIRGYVWRRWFNRMDR
jgi:hypothetical protein